MGHGSPDHISSLKLVTDAFVGIANLDTRYNIGIHVSRAGMSRPYNAAVAIAGTENTHTVAADLGRYGEDGWIVNDGPGTLYVFFSDDGTAYNTYANYAAAAAAGVLGRIEVGIDEVLLLEGRTIHTLKIDASANATAYRSEII